MPRFVISSAVKCPTEPVDLRAGVMASFEASRGAKAHTDFPAGKAALLVLSENGGGGLSFDSLASAVGLRLEKGGLPAPEPAWLRESLSGFLLQLYSAAVIELRTRACRCASAVSNRPTASPVARWQARHGDVVTSQFHITVQVQDEIGRQLLTWLDGSLDKSALADKLLQWLQSNQDADSSASHPSKTRPVVEVELERNLAKLAGLGLLIA
jgi:PKMT, C-terminal winged helix domain